MLCLYLMTSMISGVFFHHLLQECLSSFLPLRPIFSKRSKRPTPWFTPEIADKIKAKNKGKHLFERMQLESDKARYKKLKNNLKLTIRQAKIDHLQSSLSQIKSSPAMAAQMWRRVNSIIGRPAHSVPKCSDDLSLQLDSINNFFQNVALTDRHKSAESFNVPADSHDAAFQFGELSVEVVLSCLSSLDVTNATGPDGSCQPVFLRKYLVRLLNL